MIKKQILGVNVNFDITYKDVILEIDEFIKKGGLNYIWTVNPEFVMQAQKDDSFKKVLNMSNISTPDGIGLIFAERYLTAIEGIRHDFAFPIKAFLLGTQIATQSIFKKNFNSKRVTGSDLLLELAKHSAEKGYTIFLLGGWEKDRWGNMKPFHGDIAPKASEKLMQMYPNLKVIGATSSFDYQENNDQSVVEYVHQCMKVHGVDSIDIFLVGYGAKKQEEWLARNMVKIPAKVGIGVGASFDFVIGTHKRAPNIFRAHNLEWLYRLLTQPWRFKRILMAFPIFPFFVYYLSLKEHFSHK